MNLYVGNLAHNITERELKELFGSCGRVESVKIMTNRDTGRPKGFGFVEMSNRNEGLAAIIRFNGKVIHYRQIKVNEAKRRTNNRSSGYDNQQRYGGM
jgi:RNA recognition motif-containing protein